MKSFLRSNFGQTLAAMLVVVYARLVILTSKVKVEDEKHVRQFWDRDLPVIVSLWHGRLLLMPLLFKGIKVSALISEHRDGRLIAKSAKRFGVGVVSGSSSSGGAKAMRQMLSRIKDGESIFITPDGPRGPRMQLARGVGELARMSGLPILPVTITSSKCKFVKSWDRFMVPLPFSTITVRWGAPIVINPRADEALRAQKHNEIEMVMCGLQMKADLDSGCSEIIYPENMGIN